MSAPRSLRLWPGVAAVVLQYLIRFGLPLVAPDTAVYSVLGGLAGGLVVLIWWLFFSRAPWQERIAAVVLIIAALAATRPLLHPSVAGGMMGMMIYMYAIPTLSMALVAWAVAARRLNGGLRFATMAAALFAACLLWTLVRTGGIIGEASSQLAWRWTPTPEEQLLAHLTITPPALPPPPAIPAIPDWPGFRGPLRDGIIHGVRIDTNWKVTPPAELWRRAVGPGWSSFAVGGGLIYTQEQRGESEVVACYTAATGAPVWTHRDATRFWESNGGAGPRGTPALSDGRVYALGATGIVNALDANTGAVVWTRNAATDTGAKLPVWGFSGSPLVVNDAVFIAASGHLAAYDAATGKPRWVVAAGGGSYSSPHLLTLGGAAQIVLLSDDGATSVSPARGKVLWKHSWPGAAIVQPAVTAEGNLLIATASAAGGVGTRRLALTRTAESWTAAEQWTSKGLKPYFNDLVVHQGHAYGFDGAILSCIDLQDGQRKWKGGRYGHGQLVLLADQDLLLVLSEEGELALVPATPAQFTETARMPALQGKTWNHPVLFGHTLLVRNDQEMVAFRLPAAKLLR